MSKSSTPGPRPGRLRDKETVTVILTVIPDRLNKHGLEETETSITGKLARGTFAVSFFLACLAVLELGGWEICKGNQIGRILFYGVISSQLSKLIIDFAILEMRHTAFSVSPLFIILRLSLHSSPNSAGITVTVVWSVIDMK